jgi:hypothetical protein
LLNGNTSLPHALTVIKQAKELIQEVEAHLPDSPIPNFRERLAAQLERTTAQDYRALAFQQKANELLAVYESVFGIDDVVENP